MTDIKPKATVLFQVHLTLPEEEARALEALTVYGDDSFIQLFYAKLGTSELKPHQAGLRALFASIRQALSPQLTVIDSAREVLSSLNVGKLESKEQP